MRVFADFVWLLDGMSVCVHFPFADVCHVWLGCRMRFFVRALCDGAWQDYAVPIDPKLQAGKLATRFWRTLLDIQYGVVESPWSVVVG